MLITEEIYYPRTQFLKWMMALPLLFLMAGPLADIWWAILGSWALLGAIYWMLRRSFVRVDRDGIGYRSGFGLEKRIFWDKISEASVEWRTEGHSAQPYIAMSTKSDSVEIPIGYYSRASLAAICSALLSESAHAQFDKRIKQFASGKFPWYIR